ncbi:AcOrf-84 peptide [Autographa californica nucleopolyhedrovirus]|uniref:Uncharacterized 21.7 kDa protein in GP41-PNK intergenic region n=11 Tax=Autographa californica multiple nucleopolyhedrovirus TaxID=307456 RepID=Y084_NPVAC|nr:AcOrf-84 peptide [Autographa californica nucleopolyhedrovirus]P41474.1 RecName: Full=Uncharacterized 21.7 kDa protein in GP41-PNK intergenic region [Autographa californica nucleopolyhedrovirus]ARJ58768.1 Orf-84 protein [synthetic baculovirus AcMNPV-WIV-Syn1]UVY87349.1 Acorf84 protein [synthetic construct]AAA66714.1 AcOrf-84 peptide [Autographa californica nucleopolyhedrovirus]AGQ56788.1 hypothetical protein bAcMK086 [Autographa californica nucleopolyhedrovirus]AIU57047.1 AcOrf-84 [Autograp
MIASINNRTKLNFFHLLVTMFRIYPNNTTVPGCLVGDIIQVRYKDVSHIRFLSDYLSLMPNVAIVNEYGPNNQLVIKRKNKSLKSLQDLCLDKIAVSLKKPFRQLKSLNAVCLMRDIIFSLGLPIIFNPALLQRKVPQRSVGYFMNSKLERFANCDRGHVVEEKQLQSNLYIDYFCMICGLNVFKIKE